MIKTSLFDDCDRGGSKEKSLEIGHQNLQLTNFVIFKGQKIHFFKCLNNTKKVNKTLVLPFYILENNR